MAVAFTIAVTVAPSTRRNSSAAGLVTSALRENPHSTVTRTTTPLEKRGFLGRESHPHDARFAYVVLTKAGRRAVTDAQASFERLAADVFRDRWTAAEGNTLATLLGRLV